VQVDPIKPTMKAPGAEPVKPKCDELLSNLAFNFKLRRYIKLKDFVGSAARLAWALANHSRPFQVPPPYIFTST